MKLNILQIAQGWGNHFLDKLNLLPEDKKNVATTRMLICNGCKIRTDDICDPEKTGVSVDGQRFKGCGCYVDKKVLCMDCECPGSYWKPVNL
jgi:hypothetical protein